MHVVWIHLLQIEISHVEHRSSRSQVQSLAELPPFFSGLTRHRFLFRVKIKRRAIAGSLSRRKVERECARRHLGLAQAHLATESSLSRIESAGSRNRVTSRLDKFSIVCIDQASKIVRSTFGTVYGRFNLACKRVVYL